MKMMFYIKALRILLPSLFDLRNKIPILRSMADTKQWPRKPRSNANWQHLSAREIDTGKRWSIIWDVMRKPGVEGRNTALEKFEHGALDRARHILRLGFIVYEILEPSGSVFLEEADLRKRLGYAAAVA